MSITNIDGDNAVYPGQTATIQSILSTSILLIGISGSWRNSKAKVQVTNE